MRLIKGISNAKNCYMGGTPQKDPPPKTDPDPDPNSKQGTIDTVYSCVWYFHEVGSVP